MSGTTTPPTPTARGRGAVIISATAQVTFFLALAASAVIAWVKNDYTLLTAMAGVAATNATTVVGYWVGSSDGSARKTDLMSGQPPAPPAAPPVAQQDQP